jgi:hypothetical protein
MLPGWLHAAAQPGSTVHVVPSQPATAAPPHSQPESHCSRGGNKHRRRQRAATEASSSFQAAHGRRRKPAVRRCW